MNSITSSKVAARLVMLAGLAAVCGIAVAQTSQAPGASPAVTPVVPQAIPVESGLIAWYGKKFAGRRTASGERFNPEALTMAHKTLPYGTHVKVTNLKNKKSVTLRVNDRGPTQADRIGDVSLAAARQLDMVHSGVADAELEVVDEALAKKR